MRLLVSLLGSFVLLSAASAQAQVQVGAHYSAFALEYPDQTRSGLGAFFVYSPREWIGIDVSTSFFPAEEEIGGRAWQVLAGPRVGGTIAGLGIYARVRPGFVHFSERFYKPEVVCIAIFPPPESCLAESTNFALDLGGTVELTLSPRTVLRLDLGDTLIRYNNGSGGHSWKHGLQFTAGAGWRF